MSQLKSTIPGMPYPSGRDYFLKTSFGFLEGRRKDDGAEGLWRINDSLYDLESFIKQHPGGPEWLELTRGTDITEAFEVHHINDKAERLLSKFYVRKASAHRILPFTFNPDGFYRKFKMRAREVLKDVDFHRPSLRSKLIADSMVALTMLMAIGAAVFKSWIIIVACAIFMTWSTVIAHNFIHMKDNFRMYYLDITTMSSKNWRISHALSHHLYPNTIWDIEVYAYEPLLQFMPRKNKAILYQLFMIVFSPISFALSFLTQGLKRYYSLFAEWKKPEIRDIVPFLMPLIMGFFTATPFEAVKLWLCINILSSLIFNLVGITASHQHPEIFHDGDICRPDLDWGLLELDSLRDREVIDDSLFLLLTNFGLHGLHHMMPTVDHDYLKLCEPAFIETCREFNVDIGKVKSWDLVKGSFQQFLRTNILANYRGGPHCPIPTVTEKSATTE